MVSPINLAPHSGHVVALAGIQAPHSLHLAVPVSNSTPHLGHFFEFSGIRAPHSPHSTILPRPYLYRYRENPMITPATTIMITSHTHQGMEPAS